jgi:hypothetical protein
VFEVVASARRVVLADPTEIDAFAQFTDHRFFGPAPPFGGWVGVRVSL